MKIVEALAGFENDPKFNLGNHGYTLRRAKGKGASGFIAYRNEKAKEALVVNFEFHIVFVGEKGDCAGPQSEELTPLQIFSSVFGSVLFPDIAIDLLKG